MKKLFLFFFLSANFILTGYAYSFDLKGIQPLAPHGVFSTFSSESLKRGESGISMGIEKSIQPDFYRFTSNFAYGVTDNVEIITTIPYTTDWQGSTDGFEDIAIGLKHRFHEEDTYGPSIACLLSVSFPSGKKELSTEGSYGAGIIVSKKVGPVKGHVNLFYSRPGTKSLTDDITFAAGLDFSASHSFKILSELYGKKSYSGKLDRLEWRFGYRILTTETLFTTVGLGLDIKNRSPEYRFLLSLTYLIPSGEKKIQKVYEKGE